MRQGLVTGVQLRQASEEKSGEGWSAPGQLMRQDRRQVLRQLCSEAPALRHALTTARRHTRCAIWIDTGKRSPEHAFAAPQCRIRRARSLQAAWLLLGSC